MHNDPIFGKLNFNAYTFSTEFYTLYYIPKVVMIFCDQWSQLQMSPQFFALLCLTEWQMQHT